MKNRSLFWGRRALSLLLVLLLAAGLLPAGLLPAWTPAARAAEEEIPEIDFNKKGEIQTFYLYHPYMPVNSEVRGKYFYDMFPSSTITAVYFSGAESGSSIELIEKDTGRLVDISETSEERIEYKAYTLRIYLMSKSNFAEDVKIYLTHRSDVGVIPMNYPYYQASHVYFLGVLDNGYNRICAEFDLDYTYYGAFQTYKNILDLSGNQYVVAFPLAWYTKDDLLGDGSMSYDPDTGTLHLKGDVEKLFLIRWTGTEPPCISVDDDVNLEYLSLFTEYSDRLVITGNGTLNVGQLNNFLDTMKIVISGCSVNFQKASEFTRFRLENAKLAAPEGAWLNPAGQVTDENGDRVGENVAFRRVFTINEDSGDAGTIQWHYDFVTRTFSVSGSGKFERLAPYDKYLDAMEVFRTEAGVTELGDDIIRDSVHLRKVFLARTVKRVGRNNFAGCKNLTEANLPVGLEYIMSGCFSGSGLKTVSIPRTLLRIDDGCFSNMPALETVTFPYKNEDSYLVVGDGCFAHLPRAKEISFGDGPWIIGAGSFCDMPQLFRMGNSARLLESQQYSTISDFRYRIYLSEDLRCIGDYSFSDLPMVNYCKKGLYIVTDQQQPLVHQYYHLPYTVREIGRGSLGYVNGGVSGWHIDFEPPPGFDRLLVHVAARYGYANRLTMIFRLVQNGVLPSSEYTMGKAAAGKVIGEEDVQALQDYLNRPLKAITPGSDKVGSGTRTPGSDVDFSGKVDHKDLILLKRRMAGWSGLDKYFDRDYLLEELESRPDYEVYWDACEANYTAATGLKLEVGSASVEYAEDAKVRVPVRSLSNAGYIGGSVTVKWDPEAMELVDVEYNDALAPENGTGPIVNDLSYTLTKAEGGKEALVLDYAGEQVIRFGDDFRTTDITGSGELFTLVFRLREAAKPSLYSRTKTLDFEVGLKSFDLYDADLHFVRAEMTQAGTVTVRTGNAVIREIEAGGVGLPFAGQKPAATAVLPAGATYKLLEDQDLAPFGSVFWLETIDGNAVARVTQNDTFQAGKTYMVGISLVPSSDVFTFAPAAELRGTINGKWDAEIWVRDDGSEAMLTYTFTCEEGVPASALVLDQTDAALEAGESTSLQVVTYIPHNAEDLGVAWSSSDPDVASVDPNGLVTALREGAAVITATGVNGGVQASCTVTVSKRQHTILTVGAEGVAEPAVGLNPLFLARVPAGAHYKVSDSSMFGGGVVWLANNGETFYRMKETEAFRAGVTYRILVYLDPEETGADCYRFPAAEEMTAVVNGREASVQWVSDDGTQARVQYDWTPAPPWSFDKETEILATSSAVTSTHPVIVASYDEKGRFLGSAFVMAAGETGGVVKEGAKSVSFFWMDRDTGKPIYAAEKIELG